MLVAPSFARKLLNFISWEESRLKIENCSPSGGDCMFERLKADYTSPIPDILLFQRYQRFWEYLDLWISFNFFIRYRGIVPFPNFSRVSHVLVLPKLAFLELWSLCKNPAKKTEFILAYGSNHPSVDFKRNCYARNYRIGRNIKIRCGRH